MAETAPTRNARNVANEVVANPLKDTPIGDGPETIAHASMIDRMREHFAKQPKVQIRIRKEDGDQTVQVNGYTFWIKAGEKVLVPEQIADILQEAGLA